MADKAKNVVLNFKMDGQVQYAKTLKEINAVMNTAAKEYKNHIAAMGSDATATDKLRAEKKKLEIQMDAATKRTEMLRNQYEAMTKDTKTTTGQLSQMYGKLLDAEKAEMSLQKSLERVSGGLTDQAQETRDAQDALSKLKEESSRLESEQKELVSQFKLQNQELGANASEAEKVLLAQRQLEDQMKLTDRAVANLEDQLRHTSKIFGENSTEASQLRTKLNTAKSTVNDFKKSLDKMEDSGEKAEKSMDGLGSGLQALAGAAPAAAIGSLVSSMQELNTDLAKLSSNAHNVGFNMEGMEENFKKIVTVTGETDSAVETLSNLMATGFSDQQMATVIDEINGAAIRFSDTLKTEGIADGIQETFATGEAVGQFGELLERSGVDLEKFNKGLEKAKKNGSETDYVLQQLSDLGLSSAYEEYKNLNPELTKNAEAQVEQEMALADLATTLTPLVTKVTEFTTKIIEWANENPKLTEGLAIGAAAVGGLITVLTIVSPIITGVMAVMATAGITFGAIAAPIAIAVAAVAGLVAIGVVLWKNWDTITEKAGQLKDKVVNKAIELKDGFVTKVTEMKDKATGKVDELKKKATDTIQSFKDNTIKKATELKNGFVNKVNELKDGAVNKYNDLKNKATSTIQSMKNNVVNKASEIKTSFVNKVNDLKDGAVSKFNNLRDKAGEIMKSAKDKIVSPIETARDKIRGIIEKITGFFSKMKLKIPKPEMPKMPHFSLTTGSRSVMGKTITYPNGIDIDWRAKGAIFTKPTIFGAYGGRLQGAGDAGTEAALPLNAETLGMIGDGIASTMKGIGQAINVTLQIDGRTLAKIQAPLIDQELGRKKNPWE